MRDWVEDISPGTVLLALRCYSLMRMADVRRGCCDGIRGILWLAGDPGAVLVWGRVHSWEVRVEDAVAS